MAVADASFPAEKVQQQEVNKHGIYREDAAFIRSELFSTSFFTLLVVTLSQSHRFIASPSLAHASLQPYLLSYQPYLFSLWACFFCLLLVVVFLRVRTTHRLSLKNGMSTYKWVYDMHNPPLVVGLVVLSAMGYFEDVAKAHPRLVVTAQWCYLGFVTLNMMGDVYELRRNGREEDAKEKAEKEVGT